MRFASSPAAVERATQKFKLRPLRKQAASAGALTSEDEVDRMVAYLHEQSDGTWGVGQLTAQAKLDGIYLSYHQARQSMQRLGISGREGKAVKLTPRAGRWTQAPRHNSLDRLLRLVRTMQMPAPYPHRWTLERLAQQCELSAAEVAETLQRHNLDHFQRHLESRAAWCTPRELIELTKGAYEALQPKAGLIRIWRHLEAHGYNVQRSEIRWALQQLGARTSRGVRTVLPEKAPDDSKAASNDAATETLESR